MLRGSRSSRPVLWDGYCLRARQHSRLDPGGTVTQPGTGQRFSAEEKLNLFGRPEKLGCSGPNGRGNRSRRDALLPIRVEFMGPIGDSAPDGRPGDCSQSASQDGAEALTSSRMRVARPLLADTSSNRQRNPTSHVQLVSGIQPEIQVLHLPAVTEPQLRALRHFAGTPQYSGATTPTGEHLVSRQWYPNKRTVRTLMRKALLLRSSPKRDPRGSDPTPFGYRLSELGQVVVDRDRGYQLLREPSGGWVASCRSDLAFNKARADKSRNPCLPFAKVRLEDENGACIRKLSWSPRASGEDGWSQDSSA